MGRVRPAHIKQTARQLIEKYPDKFTNDFKQNQRALEELSTIKSKAIKNRIAGYITTTKEKQEK